MEQDPNLRDEHGELPVPASLLFNNRVYDLVRAATTVILPGLATLYFTIAQILNLPYGTEVTAITTAVCTFLGLLLKVSRTQYNNSDARFDGSIQVSAGAEEDTTDLRVRLDPAAVANKDQVLVKVSRDEGI